MTTKPQAEQMCEKLDKLHRKIRSHRWTSDYEEGLKELEQLVADRERLDWLEKEKPYIFAGHFWEIKSTGEFRSKHDTLRTAIDSAIAAQGEKK